MAHAPLILVVDDEEDVRELVCMNLRQAGFTTLEAGDGIEGIDAVRQNHPAAVILDVMMPKKDGYWVCEEIRKDDALKATPVIMLTAKGQAGDRIAGLEKGADDYVSKPFSPRELVLRVKAVLRRVPEPEKAELREGPFQFDHSTVKLSIDGRVLDLTLIEFKLLHTLASHRGKIVERETLLNQVWGYGEDMHTRTLDTHMKRLRTKLGVHSGWIHTSRGSGHFFQHPDGPAPSGTSEA